MSKSKYKSEISEFFNRMSDEEFVSALEEAGFEVEHAGEGKGGKIIIKDDKDDIEIKGEDDINPAIAYSIVQDMIVHKDDEESMRTWDYLYKLCLDECTHKHIDGTSSWTYPFEGIDYKICSYCSWN